MDDNMERRQNVLTDKDLDIIVEHLLEEENIDKFAAKFEERFAKRFYNGLGRGIAGFAWRGVVMLTMVVAAYGMGKGWIWK